MFLSKMIEVFSIIRRVAGIKQAEMIEVSAIVLLTRECMHNEPALTLYRMTKNILSQGAWRRGGRELRE